MTWWGAAFDAGTAIVLVVLWYFWYRRSNWHKGRRVLQWLRSSPLYLQITGVRWHSCSRMDVQVDLTSQYFHRAVFHVELLPRELPFNWLLSRFKKEKDTVSFEADLDYPPLFNLEVLNHRWANRSAPHMLEHPKGVSLVRAGALLFTTRTDWQRDLARMMHGLLASRDCNLQKVCFRRSSPHLTAVLPLEFLDGGQGAEDMFDVLEELATEASAATF